MSKLVLLGNSVNRLAGGPAWPDIMAKLAVAAGLTAGTPVAERPWPIVYEHVVWKASCDEITLKSNLATSMRTLQPHSAHERSLRLATHLLTTNYDYCFEQAARAQYIRECLKPERTYSAFRRVRIGNRFVWHIHGELDVPKTILLGLHQYAGYLQKLRAYSMDPKSSRFLADPLDFEASGKPFSWVDLFLRDDVHIAGLTMDYVEFHLWWLITHKLRLLSNGRSCGATHFYHFAGPDDGHDVTTRLGMLGDLGVRVHNIPVNGDWATAHEQLFNTIDAA